MEALDDTFGYDFRPTGSFGSTAAVDWNVWYDRGLWALQTGNHAAALIALQRAAQLNPGSSRIAQSVGDAHYQAACSAGCSEDRYAELDLARIWFRKAIQVRAGNWKARYGLSVVNSLTLLPLLEAVKLPPTVGCGRASGDRTEHLTDDGDALLDESIDNLEAVVKRQPVYLEAIRLLSGLLYRRAALKNNMEDTADAEKLMDRARQIVGSVPAGSVQ